MVGEKKNHMKTHNLHTHTSFSDGRLTAIELIDKARAEGMDILGISDHAFSNKLYKIWQIISLKQYQTMNTEHIHNTIDDYLDTLDLLNQRFDDIQVLKGVEIDVSRRSGINPSDLPFEILNKFDYILFEHVYDLHRDSQNQRREIQEIIEIRERLHLPVGLAHNDVQLNWDGQEQYIAAMLSEHDILLELNHYHNGNQREGVPYYQLFSPALLEALWIHRVSFVVGTDCHDGKNLSDTIEPMTFIENHQLRLHTLVQ